MTDLFDDALFRAGACTAAAKALEPAILADVKITRAMLNDAMIGAYGGTDAEGRWTQRESFEVLEHAIALVMRKRSALRPHIVVADIEAAAAVLHRLPTQTVRSEEQIEWQQFSTPLDLAAVALHLAAPTPQDIVLEPSAGNGLLVAQLPAVAALQLNEIDPTRRARLEAAFPDTQVSGHDGAMVATTMAALPRPGLIIMNPPFSRSFGRGGDSLAAVRHLQAAIRRVRPNGRIVAVMPDWFTHSARMGETWTSTLEQVAVRTSIRLTDAYGKHGTSVAVRLYVLDKCVGQGNGVTIQRANVRELLSELRVPERLPLSAEAEKPATRGGSVSLFRSVRSKPATAPRVFRAPTRNEVAPVTYQVLDTPAPLAEQTGVYLPYRPSRIVFDTAGEHPVDFR